MEEKQILFDHLMDGIDGAADHFYDMSPLVQKTFSGSEIRMIMEKLSNYVRERDDSWNAFNQFLFIEKKGYQNVEIKSLKNYEHSMFILIDTYQPENLGQAGVLFPLFHSYALADADPLRLISNKASFRIDYSGLAGRFFTLYGGKEYFAKFKTDLFEKAVIEIFDLKKFPEEYIFESLTKRYSYLCESPFNSDVFQRNQTITEYIQAIEKCCPEELKQEIFGLITKQNELEKQVGKIHGDIQETLKKIMDCVI